MTYNGGPGTRGNGQPVLSVLSAYTTEELERTLRSTAENMVRSTASWRIDNVTGWSTGGGNTSPQHHAIVLSTCWDVDAEPAPAETQTTELAVPGEPVTYDIPTFEPNPLSRLEGLSELFGEALQSLIDRVDKHDGSLSKTWEAITDLRVDKPAGLEPVEKRLAEVELVAKHLDEKRSTMLDYLSAHDDRLDRLGKALDIAKRNSEFLYSEGMAFPDPAPRLDDYGRRIDDLASAVLKLNTDISNLGGEISKSNAETHDRHGRDYDELTSRITSLGDRFDWLAKDVGERVAETRTEHDRHLAKVFDAFGKVYKRLRDLENFIGIPVYPTEGDPAEPAPTVTPDELVPGLWNNIPDYEFRASDRGLNLTVNIAHGVDVGAVLAELKRHLEVVGVPTNLTPVDSELDLSKYDVVRGPDDLAERSNVRAVGVDPDRTPRRLGEDPTQKGGS